MKKTMIWILAIIVMLATSLAIYDLSMSDKGELIITELKAKIGNAAAQNNLGNMYATGEGVEQNYETAKGWYEKSAKQGYAAAQNNLGIMYANGEGVEQNYETAKGWYEKGGRTRAGGRASRIRLSLCQRQRRRPKLRDRKGLV